MERDARIFVAGHRGLVGSALVQALRERGFANLVLKTRSELDLTDEGAVRSFFQAVKPQYVFMAAGRSGGILANTTYPAEFITTNLRLQTSVIHAAWECGAKKLLYMACSCVYPREAPQPMSEGAFLRGPLESTSEAFAIAKIAGIATCQAYRRQHRADFIAVVPATVYGPRDNFDPATSHFLAALLARFHQAKLERAPQVVVWGTGAPERELLYVDDLADACLFLMEQYSDVSHINVGARTSITIREVAEVLKRVVGFEGEVLFDQSKPDGAPRKLLDSSRIRSLGWTPRTPLLEGIQETYAWYRGALSPAGFR